MESIIVQNKRGEKRLSTSEREREREREKEVCFYKVGKRKKFSGFYM
jgi:hypothetical protein